MKIVLTKRTSCESPGIVCFNNTEESLTLLSPSPARVKIKMWTISMTSLAADDHYTHALQQFQSVIQATIITIFIAIFCSEDCLISVGRVEQTRQTFGGIWGVSLTKYLYAFGKNHFAIKKNLQETRALSCKSEIPSNSLSQ